MHKLIFHPLVNADCCRIDLDGGQKILFDRAATRDPDDPDDKRWDSGADGAKPGAEGVTDECGKG